MTFTSISSLLVAAARIFRRFPATILSGMLAASAAIILVGEHPKAEHLEHLLMVSALAIPLFTALTLFWEKPPWGRPLSRSWIPMAGGAFFLAFYWALLNADPGESRYLRYFQLSLAFHLAVALAPFLGRGEINGFWQFNRRLFLRLILSAIYASVFFGGLALALVAVDNLFEVSLRGEIYARLWVFTVFVFQTWHFLGGVPENLAALDGDREHPKALQIFSKYMLVPLVVLYLGILYAYMGKIVLTREWPQGWVGWLVSYAAVFGVLTLLLLHPGGQESGNRWVGRFARGFYIAVLPLLGLLFAALSKRVGQYGLTEPRYFLMVLGLWLAGIALYMLFSRAKSIKIVPLTLLLVALLTACGPLGAYGMSLRSQSRRLEALLTKYGLLSDGRLVKSKGPVDPADLKEMCAALDYLIEKHGPARLKRWLDKDWTRLASSGSVWEKRAKVGTEFMAAMGLEYAEPWSPSTYAFYSARDDGWDIGGYDLLVPSAFNNGSPSLDPGTYSARFDTKGRSVEILNGSKVVLSESLEPVLARLESLSPGGGGNFSPSDMSLVLSGPSLRVKVCFKSIMVNKGPNAVPLNAQGYLMIDTTP